MMRSTIYDVLEERVMKVIEENGDYDMKTGIGKELIEHMYNAAAIKLEIVYHFAEFYGVSIDWLLGRSEVESVF